MIHLRSIAFVALVVPAALALGCGQSTPSNTGPVGPKRVFATSVAYDGNLGGLAGADAKCANVANAGALGGSWKAWLSDSSTNAVDRIADVGPWYLVDRKTKVFNNKTNLSTLPIIAINLDENGAALVSGMAWTGTQAGGGKATENCSDWSDAAASSGGKHGLTGSRDGAWTDSGAVGCRIPNRLYCFEQ